MGKAGIYFYGLLGIVLQQVLASPKSDWTYTCTKGKNPLLMTAKEYMKAFAAGPCSPTVVLPGIMGTKLRVEVTSCPTLQAADPTTFAACNWTSCDGGPNSPKAEYLMWIPQLDSPMNIISPTELNKICMAGILSAAFTTTGGKFVPVDKPGIRITPEGYTPETVYDSKCGMKAIEDLLQGVPNPEGPSYFQLISRKLEEMGYINGLTMQAIPYDFRLSAGFDQASIHLSGVLKSLKEFANKKVVIIAHSMGNLKTASALWKMSQADKDNLIQMWASIAPPFIGATKPISYASCGSDEFYFGPVNIGLDMRTWKALVGSFPGVWELLPRTTYSTQANTPWMQKIMARIQYEKGASSDPVFSWLPTINQKCFLQFTQSNCYSGLEVLDNYADYIGSPVTNANIVDWVNKHSFSNYSANFFNIMDPNFETIPNPGVPMVLFYSTVVPTEGRFNFTQDPKVTSDQDKFCTKKDETWTNWYGDLTVPATSVVTPALKWAQEFDNNTVGAKPIKLVQICSAQANRFNPYDGKNSSGAYIVNKNEYQGIPCDCTQTKTSRRCTHVYMLYNEYLVEYLSTILNTNDVQPVSDLVNKLNDVQVEEYRLKCKILSQVWGAKPGESKPAAE